MTALVVDQLLKATDLLNAAHLYFGPDLKHLGYMSYYQVKE